MQSSVHQAGSWRGWKEAKQLGEGFKKDAARPKTGKAINKLPADSRVTSTKCKRSNAGGSKKRKA